MKVDPFQLPIPRGISPEMENYLRQLDRFLKELLERTGGGEDLIARGDLIDAMPKLSVEPVEGILTGTGVPADALGINGDYYFNRDGGIYHKSSGTWTLQI